MTQNSNFLKYQGAFFIILAGTAFAGVNALTPFVSASFNLNGSWIAFYQYFFALIIMLPWLIKSGIIQNLKTSFFWRHFWRVILAVIGVHFWIKALTVPIPIAQGLSLLMVSPLFVTLGAVFYLGESITTKRSLALISGFIGALVILNPWSESFSYVMFFPLIAAFFWASHTVMLKNITSKDSALTIVLYLYLLILPFNFLIASTNNLTHFSQIHFDFPPKSALLLLIILGAMTALGQWALAKAYSAADATYIQPFDYFKLPINSLLGFLFFGWGIDLAFIIGATLILGASIYLTLGEKPKLDGKKTDQSA